MGAPGKPPPMHSLVLSVGTSAPERRHGEIDERVGTCVGVTCLSRIADFGSISAIVQLYCVVSKSRYRDNVLYTIDIPASVSEREGYHVLSNTVSVHLNNPPCYQ